MNHVPRRSRIVQELDLAREVVARHQMPDFVTGFDVEFGEFSDAPAMWIVFKILPRGELSKSELGQYIQRRIDLTKEVRDDILNEIDDRFPFFRFEPA